LPSRFLSNFEATIFPQIVKSENFFLMLIISYLAQAIVGLTLASTFYYFSRSLKKQFLLAWSAGWLSFSLAMLFFIALTAGYRWHHNNSSLGLIISWLTLVFSYGQIYMLIVGVRQLRREDFIDWKKVTLALAAIALASAVLTLLYSGDPSAANERYFIRVGLRYFIVAVSFLITSVFLFRKMSSGIGIKIMAVSLLAYGGMQAFYFSVVIAFITGYNVQPFPGYFGVIDLVLMSGIGLGMTIWLLEEERAKLAKTNKEMDSFFYSTSHDLRAPIASLLGLTNLARLELKDPSALYYFDLVESRVTKMDSVIADILQLARITKADLKIEMIDFNKLIQDVTADIKFNSGAKEIALRYVPKSSQTFLSDYAQLKIILGNLVGNAVKYHFLQQDDPYIEIRTGMTTDEVVIEVEDNGIGIPKEYHEKIFTMFYRATTQSDGTGLGLYITMEAVTKLNGTLSVKSELGKGSTFTVRLPNH